MASRLPLRPFIVILALGISVTSGPWACWAACARHEAERHAMVRLLATIGGHVGRSHEEFPVSRAVSARPSPGRAPAGHERRLPAYRLRS